MTEGRRACRSGQRCEPRTLGEAIYCCAHHSDVDARTVAERIGKRYTYLVDAVNPDRGELQFQARLLVPLMLATGNAAPLEWLAREMGGTYVPLPQLTPADDEVRTAFMQAVRELGEDSSLIDRVLSDELVTPSEADAVDQEIDQTIRALLQTKAAIRAKVRAQSVEHLRRERMT